MVSTLEAKQLIVEGNKINDTVSRVKMAGSAGYQMLLVTCGHAVSMVEGNKMNSTVPRFWLAG